MIQDRTSNAIQPPGSVGHALTTNLLARSTARPGVEIGVVFGPGGGEHPLTPHFNHGLREGVSWISPGYSGKPAAEMPAGLGLSSIVS